MLWFSPFLGKHYYCAVNPTCYAEAHYQLPKPDGSKKRVLVIRGGWEAELYEKSDRLGGTLWPAGGCDFKKDVVSLIKYLETQCEKAGVHVNLNSEVTAENLKKGDYDRVILATGSAPVLLSGGRIWTLPICTGMGYNGCL